MQRQLGFPRQARSESFCRAGGTHEGCGGSWWSGRAREGQAALFSRCGMGSVTGADGMDLLLG